MSKVIYNPTKDKVAIQFEGDHFEVEAESDVKVDDAVADFWKKTHSFLIVREESEESEESAPVKVEEDVAEEEKADEEEADDQK